MAVSFLRIGRAGSLKKWLESRGSLASAPFAALCTKPGHPKKPARQTSTTQVDPIQKLFIEKIREYSSKSNSNVCLAMDSGAVLHLSVSDPHYISDPWSTGVLVDAGPEYERNLAEEINRLQRLYGGGDLTKFPDFKFPEPKLEEMSTK